MTYTREYHRGAIHALNEVLAGRLVYYIIDDLRRHHCLALAAMPDEPPAPEPTYPCRECGLPRTEAEGGKTFTVCDACWEAYDAALAMIEQRKAGR